MVTQAIGIVFAIASAIAWGGADFCGGLASRRSTHLEVLALSRVALLTVLTTSALVAGEAFPPMVDVRWAAAAGGCGALGLAALYKGLATERSSLVIPAAGVFGAAIPVLFSAIVDGLLPVLQQVGLALALGGIWLVSEGHRTKFSEASHGLILGVLAGLGFGAFFVFLGQVEPGPTFAPLAVASSAGLVVASIILLIARAPLPSPRRNPVALLTGVLDAAGAVFYFVAIRWIRIDVAAVLGSLYPAIAVLLFWYVLKERVARAQWVGIALCVAAIALIVV
jgi:drug/metabolite transporter (DMT)-like permease